MEDFRSRRPQIIFRSLLIWLLIIFAETLHGTARTLLLEPYVGDFRARQIGVLTGALMILIIAYAFIRWLNAKDISKLICIGLIWSALTFVFEISFGRFALGLSWERIFSDYDLARGGLMPVGLLLLMLSPLIVAKLRRII